MKIERRYMAHYLNAGFGGAENYCRLGADLEEYSPELTANVEKKSNILGQTSVTIDGYQIPFNVHYTGVKRKGKFDIKTKKFTAE